MVSKHIELTRPANSTAYLALDTIADSASAPTMVFDFTSIALECGGAGYIVKAQIATTQITNVARFRLHLFTVSPTLINDNEPYKGMYSNFPNRVGTIDFPAMATEDSTSSTQAVAIATPGVGNLPLAFKAGALYGLLETLDAFSPASSQKITIRLTAEEQN